MREAWRRACGKRRVRVRAAAAHVARREEDEDRRRGHRGVEGDHLRGGAGAADGRSRARHEAASSRERCGRGSSSRRARAPCGCRRAGRRRTRIGGGLGRCLRAEAECEVACARVQTAGEHNESSHEGGEMARRSRSGTRVRSAGRSRAAQTDRTPREKRGCAVVRPSSAQCRPHRSRYLQKTRSSSGAHL